MENLRSYTSLNLNMPGTIETEHPHRFLTDLRPLEDFRHTPLIPISDKEKKAFQDRLDKHHRSALYFEISPETIFQYLFIGIAGFIAYKLLNHALELEDQADLSYYRLKEKRNNEPIPL